MVSQLVLSVAGTFGLYVSHAGHEAECGGMRMRALSRNEVARDLIAKTAWI